MDLWVMGGGFGVCEVFLNLEDLGVNPHRSQDRKEGAQRMMGRARSEAWLNHNKPSHAVRHRVVAAGIMRPTKQDLLHRNTNRERQVLHLQVPNPEAFVFAGQVIRAQRHAGDLLLGNWAPKRGP